MEPNNQQLKYQLILHVIVLIWGFTGILGKLISISSEAIVWYRMLIAFIGLFTYALLVKLPIKVSLKSLGTYLTIGFIVAAHWVLFFEAIKVSTVSVALATMASATLFTSVLEPLFYKRKIVGYEILFGILVIAGLVLIFNFETQYNLGIVLALISAFCASLFTTLNGKLISKQHKGRVISLYEMAGGTIAITAYFLFTQQYQVFLAIPSLNDSMYLLVLGLVCTSLAFVASVEVMKHLTPYTVSISINMEPIYSIILALLFFGEEEKMTPGFYAGAILIFLTILLNAFFKRRNRLKTKAQKA